MRYRYYLNDAGTVLRRSGQRLDFFSSLSATWVQVLLLMRSDATTRQVSWLRAMVTVGLQWVSYRRFRRAIGAK